MPENENTPKKNKGFGSGFVLGFVCCVILAIAAYGGQYLYDNVLVHVYEDAPVWGSDDSDYDVPLNERSIGKITQIGDIINARYYRADEVSSFDLETGIYRGMLEALGDPYAAYYTAEELVAMNNDIEGIFYGIGAMVSYDENQRLAVISGIIEGGSAAESDLREGDYIIRVDDVDVTDYSTSQVVALIRGPENTPVQITVYREGTPDYIVFDLIRKKMLEKSTVYHELTDDEKIGYISISEFDNITIGQFAEALADLKEQGIQALIIDIRSNPGGNINSVTNIARQLLPEGLIVYTEDRAGGRREYACDGDEELKMPLTVLVNEYSASASEILAGAIQDHGTGTIIGTATFGKGVVQQIISLADDTAIKFTVSEYYTPLGRSLGGEGIAPDIEIEFDRDAYYEDGIDNQLDKAIEVLQEMLGR